MSGPTIGYAGMTHLGLTSAVAGAAKGFDMLCFDPDQDLIGDLERGVLPVFEPDLPELIEKNRARISFTADPAALARCDVVYVAPDVATDDHGVSDLSTIDGLLARVQDSVAPGATVVVLSQVPPGFTRARRRDGGVLYYQVETLIFGRAMERALHPERIIVGCDDPDADMPEAYGHFIAAFDCPVLPMRYESAELCKIAINCFLVASVSTTNTLAELCEGIGAVWSEIAPALRLDRRIGPHAYLAPGLGIAGGNLERDLATVIRLSERTGGDATVVRSYIHNSAYRKDWALRTLFRSVLATSEDPLIAVLGLAYKENTHSVKGSPSLALVRALAGHRVRAFDPAVAATGLEIAHLEGAADAEAAIRGADALVVMTPWPEFRTLEPGRIGELLAGRTVIDPFAVLDGAACRACALDYWTLGTHHA